MGGARGALNAHSDTGWGPEPLGRLAPLCLQGQCSGDPASSRRLPKAQGLFTKRQWANARVQSGSTFKGRGVNGERVGVSIQ